MGSQNHKHELTEQIHVNLLISTYKSIKSDFKPGSGGAHLSLLIPALGEAEVEADGSLSWRPADASFRKVRDKQRNCVSKYKTQNHEEEFHCILFIKHTFVYCVVFFLLLLSGIAVLALTSDCNYLSIMFS